MDRIKKKKEETENENRRKKQKIPFMQVDKSGDILSNFFSNFMRQFRNRKGIGLKGVIKGFLSPAPVLKRAEGAKFPNIMGSTQNDTQIAKERREHWKKKLKGMPAKKHSNSQHASQSLKNGKAVNSNPRSPGLRL